MQRSAIYPLIIILVSCALGGAAAFYVAKQQEELIALSFKETAAAQSFHLASQIELELSQLNAIANYFSAREWVTAEEFSTFDNQLITRASAVLPLSWTGIVPANEIDGYVARIRRTNPQTHADFQIKVRPGDELGSLDNEFGDLIVSYALPRDRFDIEGLFVGPGNPVYTPSMSALYKRTPITARMTRLSPSLDSQPTTYIIFPVYDGTSKTAKPKGLITAPLRLDFLFAGNLSQEASAVLDLYVVDRDRARAVVYDVKNHKLIPGLPKTAAFAEGATLRHDRDIKVANRTWILVAVPTEGAFALDLLPSYLIALASMIAGSMIAFTMHQTQTHNVELRQRVFAQTEELQEHAVQIASELATVEKAAEDNIALAEDLYHAREESDKNAEFLNNIMDNVSQAIIVFDRDFILKKWNQHVSNMLDIPEQQLKAGMSASELYLIFCQHRMPAEPGPEGNEWLSFVPESDTDLLEFERYGYLTRDDKFLAGARSRMTGGGFICTFSDITEQYETQDTLRHMAHYDQLTGLVNRTHFIEIVNDAIQGQRKTDDGFVLAMIDLDKFKPVNDNYGHAMGDNILAWVGKVLRAHVREGDVAARLGGDEFAFLFNNVSDVSEAAAIAERLIADLSQTMKINGHTITIGASIGVAAYPQHGLDAETLFKVGDDALYASKHNGRGTVSIAKTADGYQI